MTQIYQAKFQDITVKAQRSPVLDWCIAVNGDVYQPLAQTDLFVLRQIRTFITAFQGQAPKSLLETLHDVLNLKLAQQRLEVRREAFQSQALQAMRMAQVEAEAVAPVDVALEAAQRKERELVKYIARQHLETIINTTSNHVKLQNALQLGALWDTIPPIFTLKENVTFDIRFSPVVIRLDYIPEEMALLENIFDVDIVRIEKA